MLINWVDLLIILILFFFALEGLGRSFIGELSDFLSFVVALFFSLRFYNLLSKQLEVKYLLPHSLANVLGFIGAWFLIEIVLLSLERSLMIPLIRKVKLPYERFLSVIPATLRGLVFVAIFLVLTATFPIQPQVKKAVDSSKLGSLILNSTYQLETPLKNVFGGLSQDTLTFLTVEPKTDQSVNIGFKTDKFFFDESLEMSMIDLVNKERKSRNLEKLSLSSSLRAIARDHSADMFTRGYFSHYSPEGENVAQRAEKAGINYLVIGENLAFAPTLQLAHQGLMNSEGHRANILSLEYHQIGIGIAHSDDYGLMITQVFKN